MLDIGWSEMAMILMVALIVIGPKDLPRLARTIGQWTAKARSMAREFHRSLDDMAREAELQDIKKELDKVRSGDVASRIKEHVDPGGEMRKALEAPRLDEGKAALRVETAEADASDAARAAEAVHDTRPVPDREPTPEPAAPEPAHAGEKR